MNSEFTKDELSKIFEALSITLDYFSDFFPVDKDCYTLTEQQIDRKNYEKLYNKVKNIIKK